MRIFKMDERSFEGINFFIEFNPTFRSPSLLVTFELRVFIDVGGPDILQIQYFQIQQMNLCNDFMKPQTSILLLQSSNILNTSYLMIQTSNNYQFYYIFHQFFHIIYKNSKYSKLQMKNSHESSGINLLRTQSMSRPEEVTDSQPKKKRSSLFKKISGAHIFAVANQKDNNQSKRNSKKHSTLIGYQKADWDKAVQNRNKLSNRYYKGQQVYWNEELKYFSMYGPGIYLFFSFLKYIAKWFALFALISLVPIVYNYMKGSTLSSYKSSNNVYFAKTTIANFSSSTSSDIDKYINTISDIVIALGLFVAYLRWLYNSSHLVEDLRKEVKMRSYTVLELIEFKSNATEEDVKEFMGQFGKVTEVAAVRSCDRAISLSKKIYDKQWKIRELTSELAVEQHKEGLLEQIDEIRAEIELLYGQLYKCEQKEVKEVLKFYVSFETIEEKHKAIRQIKRYENSSCLCCEDAPPPNLLLLNQRVKVIPCHTQPGQIIWQNMHITWSTRWIRASLQFLFLLLLVVIGFVFISFLNILTPSSTNSYDVSGYTSTTILSQTNTSLVQTWCIANVATVSTSGTGSALYSLCYNYIFQYYIKMAITVGISIAIIVMKTILKIIVIKLAQFQRYTSHTEQSVDIIKNLYFTYIFTTVIITFLLQASIFGISFKNMISLFINDSYLNTNVSNLNSYTDFVSNWYVDIGYQIFLTWVIMAIHPTLTMPIVYHITQCWNQWKAKSEKIQKKMEERIKQQTFDIEENYANILVIISVTVTLSAGIPIIYIPCAIALATRYFYFKYLFIRFSQIPKTLDEALDNQVLSYVPWLLILHFLFGIWMFGGTAIFPGGSSIISTYISSFNNSYLQQISFLLDRLSATWYYTAVTALLIVFMLLKQLIYQILAQAFKKKPEDKSIVSGEINPDLEIKSDRAICSSYLIENNPNYAEILAIMNKKKKYFIKMKESL